MLNLFTSTNVTELGYKLQLTDEAKDFISDRGYDVNYGARP